MFKESTILQVCKVTFITITSILAVYLTHSILILFLVFLLSQTLANIIGSLFFGFKKVSREKLSNDIQKKYLHYAQHLSIQNVIIGISTRIDNVLVFQHLGSANLALFSIATLIPDQIKGATKNLATLLIPKFAKHSTINQAVINLPKRSLQLFGILVGCSLLLICITPYIYQLFFPKYIEATFYSQLLLLALPASVYFIPLSALQSHLKGKELYQLNIYSALFQIVTTVVFIYTMGILGAILSRIISRYFQTLLSYFLIYRTR